jgi:hypothetical protein
VLRRDDSTFRHSVVMCQMHVAMLRALHGTAAIGERLLPTQFGRCVLCAIEGIEYRDGKFWKPLQMVGGEP